MRAATILLISAALGCRPEPPMPTMPSSALDPPPAVAPAPPPAPAVTEEAPPAVAEDSLPAPTYGVPPPPAPTIYDALMPAPEPLEALPSRPAIVELPAIGPRAYFALPPDAPTGERLQLPTRDAKEGDRRTVTMIVRDYDDDGRPSRTRRIEIDERVDRVRGGRPYATTMTILDARRREHGADTRIVSAGEYVRLDQPAMFGDSGTSVTFMGPRGIVGGEEQALYDFDDEESNVERTMDVLRTTPLRVGESSMPHKVFGLGLSHMAVNTIRREPDRAGAARFVLRTDDGDRRAIVTVDPVRGRPLAYHMEWAWHPATFDLTFRYPD